MTYIYLLFKVEQCDTQILDIKKFKSYEVYDMWTSIKQYCLVLYSAYAIYFAGVLFSWISWVGCYSRIQQQAKINLPPIPTQECDLCIRNISSTVHSARANEWMIPISPSIALLLDREFNHSQKCLEVPIREKLDSQNIWRIQY